MIIVIQYLIQFFYKVNIVNNMKQETPKILNITLQQILEEVPTINQKKKNEYGEVFTPPKLIYNMLNNYLFTNIVH